MAQFRKIVEGNHKSDSETHTALWYSLKNTVDVCDQLIEEYHSNIGSPSFDKGFLEKYKDRKMTHQRLLDHFVLVHEDYELFKIFWASEVQSIIDAEKINPKPFNKIRYDNYFLLVGKFLSLFEYMDLLIDEDIFDEKPKPQSKFKQLIYNFKLF